MTQTLLSAASFAATVALAYGAIELIRFSLGLPATNTPVFPLIGAAALAARFGLTTAIANALSRTLAKS